MMEGENVSQKEIDVSISLLVSNHKDTIRKCMESIVPLLNTISSELIVVDTGSTDGSIDIVREYTNNIISFVWCNDFSAARNAGLQRAKGEWFLYLDDDEWFEDISEIITFFQSGEYKEYDAAWYIQRNYNDWEGMDYTDAYVSRMCKRVPNLHFEKRVHEVFSYDASAIKQFSSYVHHYGYVFDTLEEKRKKSERNIPLVEAELQENPKDIRMAVQLLQEYMFIEKLEEAEKLREKILRENPNSIMDIYMQYCIVCQVRIESIRKDWEKIEEKVKEVESKYPLNYLAKLVCMVERIIAAKNRSDFSMVLRILPDYFKLQSDIQNMENAIKNQKVSDFIAYLSPVTEKKMVIIGIQSMLQVHDFSIAKQCFEKINWEQEKKSSGLLAAFVQIYIDSKQKENFFPYCMRILENSNLVEEFCNRIERVLLEFPDRRNEIITEFEMLQRKESFFLLLHTEYCLKVGNVEHIRQAIYDYFSTSKGKYDAKITAIFLMESDYINEILEWIDFETWKEGIRFFLEYHSLEHIMEKLDLLEKGWNRQKIVYFYYLEMVIYEEYLLKQKEFQRRYFWNYIDSVISYTEVYFSKALLQESHWVMLPRNGQFAFWMKKAMSYKEAGEIENWKESVRQASKIYAPMIPVVKVILQEENETQKGKKVSLEMRQLAEELKKNIRNLIAMGDTIYAKELLFALEQYVPEDKELEQLKCFL